MTQRFSSLRRRMTKAIAMALAGKPVSIMCGTILTHRLRGHQDSGSVQTPHTKNNA